MIRVDRVSKSIGSTQALRDVSFRAERGQVLGLLGPNGAGKTTTIRILSGLLPATSGEVNVGGFDAATQAEDIRRIIGLVTENPSVYESLTAAEYLDFFGRLHGLSAPERRARVSELLSLFGLEDRGKDLLRTYSKGMRQKVCLARALLHRPAVLYLDEPTSGLDPVAARVVKDAIRDLHLRTGVTVILCSHDLHVVAELCDRIVILRQGRVLDCRGVRDLKHSESTLVVRLARVLPEYLRALRSAGWPCDEGPDSVRIRVGDPERDNPVIVEQLVRMGAVVIAAETAGPTLEDHYLKLMGARDA
jgi:ABC-2 type transport system ATP-binding protein